MHGADSPCSVDVGFEPKLFFVFQRRGSYQSEASDYISSGPEHAGFWVQGQVDGLCGFSTDGNNAEMSRPLTVNGTVVSWYLETVQIGGANLPEFQLNMQNKVYIWFALG